MSVEPPVRLFDPRPAGRPYADEVERRLCGVIEHGSFILGPELTELETALAAYVGVEHAIGVSDGTRAIELALRALEIGPGHEVITSAFSFVGSADPIAVVGAEPVFVDIEPRSFSIDIEGLERAVSPRTRAIIGVSLFGRMPDYDAIERIAARHGLAVIEDAAQSFGAALRGQKSCSVTRVACTSFFPTKPLGCYGDGGAIFTRDRALAERLRMLRCHGAAARGEYALLGTNSRLDTLQAAVLLAKLPHLDRELAARERIARRYQAALSGVVATPGVATDGESAHALYTIRSPERDELARFLSARGIATGIYYGKCLHQQPLFASARRSGSLFEAERAAREVLSLPMHPYLTEAEQARVIASVLAAFER